MGPLSRGYGTCTCSYRTSQTNQPYHSPCRGGGAVAPVRSFTLTEPYLRLIRTQHSLRSQCSRWHGDVGKELGLKDVVVRIVRVLVAGTTVNVRTI